MLSVKVLQLEFWPNIVIGPDTNECKSLICFVKIPQIKIKFSFETEKKNVTKVLIDVMTMKNF